MYLTKFPETMLTIKIYLLRLVLRMDDTNGLGQSCRDRVASESLFGSSRANRVRASVEPQHPLPWMGRF